MFTRKDGDFPSSYVSLLEGSSFVQGRHLGTLVLFTTNHRETSFRKTCEEPIFDVARKVVREIRLITIHNDPPEV